MAAALTFGTGALDVVAITHLGVFASVITGNLALTGFAVAHADLNFAAHSVVAIAGFVTGVAAGTRITTSVGPDRPRWPPHVTIALAAEVFVLVAFATGWEVTRAAPTGMTQLGLLGTAAVGMGLQSAAMRGLGIPVATTYLTGTLTGVVAALAGKPRGSDDHAGIAALVAAVVGAICGALVLSACPRAATLLTLIPLTAVVVTAGISHRRHGRPPHEIHCTTTSIRQAIHADR